MGSRTDSPRRRASRRRDRLEAVAAIIDQAGVGDARHGLVYLEPLGGGEVQLGVRSLDEGCHPFGELAGLTAPPTWEAFGVRAVGTAQHLDDPEAPAWRAATTFLVDRHGHEVALVRSGSGVDTVPGRLTGTIPDACRRVLGLPTDPPPPSTAAFWTLLWLDRVMQAWNDPSRRRSLASWPIVAGLHPAVAAGAAAPAHPDELVELGRAHTRRWSWSALRRRADLTDHLELPGGGVSQPVADWMDEGFLARWLLGGFPSIRELATDLPALLRPPVGAMVATVALALVEDETDPPAGP